MKKILAVLLASGMCLSIAACGSDGGSTPPADKGIVSSTSKTNSKTNAPSEYGLVTDTAALHDIGLKNAFGVISVPRTTYDLYVNLGREAYYKLAMNTQEWLFPADLRTMDDAVGNVSATAEFFAADTKGQLLPVSVRITDERIDETESDSHETYQYNGWDFVVYADYNGRGYYPLEEGYYLEADLSGLKRNAELSDASYQAFLEAVSKNIAVEKLTTTGPNRVVLPARFSNLKLNDKFSLNLVDHAKLERWISSPSKNGIQLVMDSNQGVTVFEYPDGATMENQKASLGDSFTFQSYTYRGLDLELVYWAKDFEVLNGSAVKGKCAGFLLDIDGRIYQIDHMTPMELADDAALQAYLDSIFGDLLLYQ